MREIDLVSEHDKWAFQALRLAYIAFQGDDQKLEEFLANSDTPAEKILDDWLAAAELFDRNAELLTKTLERSVALEKVLKRVRFRSG